MSASTLNADHFAKLLAGFRTSTPFDPDAMPGPLDTRKSTLQRIEASAKHHAEMAVSCERKGAFKAAERHWATANRIAPHLTWAHLS